MDVRELVVEDMLFFFFIISNLLSSGCFGMAVSTALPCTRAPCRSRTLVFPPGRRAMVWQHCGLQHWGRVRAAQPQHTPSPVSDPRPALCTLNGHLGELWSQAQKNIQQSLGKGLMTQKEKEMQELMAKSWTDKKRQCSGTTGGEC